MDHDFFRRLKVVGFVSFVSIAALIVLGMQAIDNGERSQRETEAASAVLSQAAASEIWSMGYYAPWTNLPISEINWGALTHVIHFAARPLSNGSLDMSSESVSNNASGLVSAAHANGAKALLGLWSPPGSDFKGAISNNLYVFVDNIANTVNMYGYDGVDVDWEDQNLDFNLMASFLSALRAKLGTAKVITAAAYPRDYTSWGPLSGHLDRVSVMTYIMSGTWDSYLWHNSALLGPTNQSVWSIDLAKARFLAGGVPAAKLNIGVPFFGYIVRGCQNAGCTEGLYAPYQAWSGAPEWHQIFFQELPGRYNLGLSYWDALAHVPYLSLNSSGSSNDEFVTYENAQSIVDKIKYAKDNGLGGWIIWSLGMDYFPGAALSERQPLLEAVKNTWQGSNTPPAPIASPTTTPASSLGASLTVSPSSGRTTLKVSLSAMASGTAMGPVTYTFYCNRPDTGTNITPDYALQMTINSAQYKARSVCSYAQAGTYQAKVIIERAGLSSQAQAQVTVSSRR